MDKNFFRFDIDDEVLSSNLEKSTSQNVHEKIKETSKAVQNENFFWFKGSKKGTSVSKTGYEKKKGRMVKREINPNLFQVEDYINFDFRAKNKKIEIEENKSQIDNQLQKDIIDNFIGDEEVKDVIEKAQIGVIFY